MAEVFRSQCRSRSRLEDLATKQSQQLQAAEEAAKAADQRRVTASAALDQAKTHLGQLTTRVRGMGQQSKELHGFIELECEQEAAAMDALGASEKQQMEALGEIAVLESHMGEAQTEEALLVGLVYRQESSSKEATRSRDHRRMAGHPPTRCQKLAAEQEALEQKLQRRNSEFQQVREEQEAAIPNLEHELEILEAAIQRPPEEMHAALDVNLTAKKAWEKRVSELESELRAAHRQRAEQQRKMTLLVANCRREIESREAAAKCSSAQCLKPMETAYQEALQRHSERQKQIRQHKTKRQVGNAFKVPLLQQRASKPQAMEAPDATGPQATATTTTTLLRRCSMLRFDEAQQRREVERLGEREQRAAAELHEKPQSAGKLRGNGVDQADVQMAYWRDCVDSLRREETWLVEECRTSEVENEAQEGSQMQAIRQLQQELRSSESTGWDSGTHGALPLPLVSSPASGGPEMA